MMKILDKTVIKAAKKLQYWYYSIFNSWYFKHMCKKAEKQHFITGKRYWVIPVSKYKLMVVNNDWLYRYNRLVTKEKRIDIVELNKMAYYTTGTGTLRKRTLKTKTNV